MIKRVLNEAFIFFILLLVAFISISVNAQANNEQEVDDLSAGYEWYIGTKGYFYHKVKPFNRPHRDADDIRIFAGLRYNKLVSQDWLFDTDIRAVYQVRNGLNPVEEDDATFLEVKKLKFVKENLFDSLYWKAELGRKRLTSRDSWLYDDEIDFIELSRQSTLLSFDIFAAKWLWDGRLGAGYDALDDEQRIESSGSRYLGVELDYTWHFRHHFQVSYLFENFENPRTEIDDEFNAQTFVHDSRLSWLRLGFYGEKQFTNIALNYWLDLATVFGERNISVFDELNTTQEQSIESSYAYRLGFSLVPENMQVSMMAGYDVASGDEQLTDDSILYIQPYVASNRRKMLGMQKRRMYGEVIAPRLSNLAVFYVSTAYALSAQHWFELSYFHYRQRKALTNTFQFRENILSSGLSNELGWGLDLSWAREFQSNLLIESTLGYFKAGDAFDGILERDEGYRIYLNMIKRW